ncbi:MAG: alcohol dehydrogenase catalytic domain-containing protein [Candidatus Tectomicrobia bacterium]|uniref:Alcohol dehydrogenase catalytic domain-containing protein n=1 Tax=Tectimicrobiota bacterium TaxID=2528274 RepID=A0A933EA00_UNCTE|nr:alcohol dehydrogenase catalytic domain-containing protein [Candidatus Tectomicrobia bacterium]
MVEVGYCGICGTDLHEYRHGPLLIPRRPHPLTGRLPPVVMGHEFSGTVVARGAGVSSPREGARVTVNPCLSCGQCAQCNGGKAYLCPRLGSIGFAADGAFAGRVVCPSVNCHPIPDGLPSAGAALSEPLAACIHAWGRGGGQAGEAVLIVGAGTVGLLLLQVARTRGAGEVFVVEPLASRQEAAEALGAAATFNPAANRDFIRTLRDEIEDLPLVFECVGQPSALETALRASGRGGRVVVVGLFAEPVPVDFLRLFAQEKAILASCAYTDAEMDEAVAMLAEGQVAWEPIVSGTIRLEDILAAGFEALANAPSSHIKLLVNPAG